MGDLGPTPWSYRGFWAYPLGAIRDFTPTPQSYGGFGAIADLQWCDTTVPDSCVLTTTGPDGAVKNNVVVPHASELSAISKTVDLCPPWFSPDTWSLHKAFANSLPARGLDWRTILSKRRSRLRKKLLEYIFIELH